MEHSHQLTSTLFGGFDLRTKLQPQGLGQFGNSSFSIEKPPGVAPSFVQTNSANRQEVSQSGAETSLRMRPFDDDPVILLLPRGEANRGQLEQVDLLELPGATASAIQYRYSTLVAGVPSPRMRLIGTQTSR